MKKFVCVLMVVMTLLVVMSGCNRQLIDTTWSFEKAIIFLPDGEKIEGKVTSWGDYDNSDMIQVSVDGKMYLTHSSNVVLISE
jgi:hypothetical protein